VYLDALAIQKRLAAEFPKQPEYRQALAGMYNNLGNLLFNDTSRLPEAEKAQTEALAIRQELVAEYPTGPIFRRALAMSHNNLGWLYQSSGRPEKAELAFRDAVAAQRQAVSGFANRAEFRLELAKYLINLGNLLRDKGRLKDAEAIYGEALPLQKQLAAEYPSRPEYREELASGHSNVGLLLRDKGLPQDAGREQSEALAIRKQLSAEFPEVSNYRNAVAGALFNLADLAIRRRDFAAARGLVDEALPYHQAALKANPGHTDYRSYYRNNLVLLTQSFAGLGDRPAALATATKRRDLGWNPALDAYEAACMLTLCVPLVEKTDKLDAAKRQAEMAFYADTAMVMLGDAVAKGYKDHAHMREDKYLDPLRARDDFKKILADLEAAGKGPSKNP
jgi:tetratricopeptide (TPR) repeat protein